MWESNAEAEGGFALPECKSSICWKDRDTLLVGGVFGEEEMTDSGYPRTVAPLELGGWKRCCDAAAFVFYEC